MAYDQKRAFDAIPIISWRECHYVGLEGFDIRIASTELL